MKYYQIFLAPLLCPSFHSSVMKGFPGQIYLGHCCRRDQGDSKHMNILKSLMILVLKTLNWISHNGFCITELFIVEYILTF